METLEITCEKLDELQPSDYHLIDVRTETERGYGMIPGAEAAAPGMLEDPQGYCRSRYRDGELVVLYCKRGELTPPLAKKLRAFGVDARYIAGGYEAWVLWDMKQGRTSRENAEADLRKTYHKQLFTPFAKAINRYEMLSEGDRVAVCISGGKDSFLMAKLFQELLRHRKFHFEVTFLCMDPGYNATNRRVIEDNARILGVPLEIFPSDIFDVVDVIDKNPCYLCARMRRGHLYAKAKELGCNKIALGHHYDDVIETTLMGMLYGAQMQTMMPKIRSTNFEGMELIRPMYLIREEDIRKWREHNNLHFIQCACHFTDTCSTEDEEGNVHSSRLATKKLIRELKKDNPYVESNIFNSAHNVNLSTVLAYKKDGVVHDFLEWY